MKYYIVAEVREDYPSMIDGSKIYNDYVSKQSMIDFCSALCKIGYDCVFFGGMKKLMSAYQTGLDVSDIIFINYNYGLPGAYKRTQCPTLLELMAAKYSGVSPFIALLVNDKEFTKKVLRSVGIQTPRSIVTVNSGNVLLQLKQADVPLPLVVKPNCEGSSLGITEESLCDTYEDAVAISSKLLPLYREIIIEQYISGYECTVWLIGNPGRFRLVAPLLISEKGNYYFTRKIFTIEDKANRTREYSLPEPILGIQKVNELKKLAETIFYELELRDYARLDFRIAKDGIYFIEANALPVFSKTSEIGEITQLYGIPYENICQMMIESINVRLMTQAN